MASPSHTTWSGAADARTVKRKRSISPSLSREHSTQLYPPHQSPRSHPSAHPSLRGNEIESNLRSSHSRSHASAFADSTYEDHNSDAATRSPHPHSLHATRRPSSSSGAGHSPRFPTHQHHAVGPSVTPDAGLAHSPSSIPRHDKAASPSMTHPYRPRSPTHYHSSATSSAQAKAPTHRTDLHSDLASITWSRQRGSSSSSPAPTTAITDNMEGTGSKKVATQADGYDSSATASSTPVVVKKEQREQSTPSDKPRGGQACLECRLAKVRCLASDESESCQRCHRFNFECMFVQHKRGRKPKSKLQGRDLTLLAEAASATNAAAVPKGEGSFATNVKAGTPTPIHPTISAVTHQAGSSSSSRSPGVRWSSATDNAFPAGPNLNEYATQPPSDARQAMDIDVDAGRAESPFSAFFSKKQPVSTQIADRAALDPKNLFGVDVTRMTQAMSQAMRSMERRRGAPYTLVTNNEIASTEGQEDDAASGGGTPLTPAAATTADTNAANESFELIAEQPLTLRVMLKPFEVSDQPDCETPRIQLDDRLAAQAACQPQLNDPITQGIVTEPAARALFDFYMQNCNLWSGSFDPLLYTHDFVRKRSSFLYTVLLYIGARFSTRPSAQHLTARQRRGENISEADWDVAYADPVNDRTEKAADDFAKQIRKGIHEMARQHAARAFVDGDRTVLCCQAFFILASWKPLDDGLSVIQVGYAFRLAMDIQLHAEMPNCVKPSESNLDQAGKQRYEAVQRRFRNRQRTFLMLFVQDKSQQIANKITTHSISADNVLIRRCQTWWKHAGAIPSDAFVCASADIRRIQGKYVELYDRIEALSSATSDGPSVMMPAFLSDLAEWSARWHDALGLREDVDDDMDDDRRHLDEAAYRRKCQRLCLKLWQDNIKTYVSSLVLKSSLKQAALQAHQEIVRNHHRRSTTRGTDERAESISSKLQLGLEPGVVNLMAMPAFWPCVEGARGVLEAVCAFPSAFLLTSPDATVMQTTHAAVLLCSLATVKSQPPLGPGYLRSNIQLIDQASAAFRKASITEDDTVLHIARYLESLLRPKNAAPSQSRAAKSDDAPNGGAALRTAEPTSGLPLGSEGPISFSDGSSSALPTNGAGAFSGSAVGMPGSSGLSQLTNFTLLSNDTDLFYSNNGIPAGSANARWTNGGHNAVPTSQNHGSNTPHDGSLFFNGNMGGAGGADNFNRDGLDAIAAAAAAAAAAQNGSSGAMDLSGVGWSNMANSNGPPAWNSMMFGGAANTNQQTSGVGGARDSHNNNNNNNMFNGQSSNEADETLRMLLRFLDG